MPRIPKDIYEYLREVGGSNNAAVNGGTLIAPLQFYYAPDTNVEITRITIQVKDGGINSADNYGAIAALTNGVKLVIRDIASDEIVLEMDGGEAFKTNGEYARVSYDVDYTNGLGAGDDYVDCRWSYEKSGKPLFVYEGERIEAMIRDSLAALSFHTFFIMGQKA